MTESDDRVEQALAAHVEHREVGGPKPDVSHLTPAEQEELQALIDLLDQTEGIPFGRGIGERPSRASAATDEGTRLVAAPAVFQMFSRAPGGAEMIDDFGRRLSEFIVSAGEELHRGIVEVLRRARDERADASFQLASKEAEIAGQLARLAAIEEALWKLKERIWADAAAVETSAAAEPVTPSAA